MNEEEGYLADLETSKTAEVRAAAAAPAKKKTQKEMTVASASKGRRTSTRKRSSANQDDEASMDSPRKKRNKRAISKKENIRDDSQKENSADGRKLVAKKLCSSEGCTNQVQRGGVCKKHGTKIKFKRCSKEGCSNQAQRGGACVKHGANRKLCSSEGCTKLAVKGGVCVRHGAKVKRCISEGCTNQARKGGVCVRHGAKVKLCSSVGCTNQAQNGGDLFFVGLRHPKGGQLEGPNVRPKGEVALSGLEHSKQSISSLMNEVQSQAFCHFVETNGLLLPVVDSNFQVQDSSLFQSFVQEVQLTLEKGEEFGIGIAFHGTAECNIAPILREGLDPTKRRGQAHGPGEYFSPRPTLPIRFCRGGRQVLIFLVLYEPSDIRTNDIIVVNNTRRQLPIGTISFANTTSNARAAADSFYEHVNQLVQEKNKKEMMAREARSKEKIIRLLISGEYFAASDVYNNVCKNGSPSKVWADEVSLYVYDHIRNEEQICVYFPGLPSRPKEAACVSSLNVVKCEDEAVQAREKYEKVEKIRAKTISPHPTFPQTYPLDGAWRFRYSVERKELTMTVCVIEHCFDVQAFDVEGQTKDFRCCLKVDEADKESALNSRLNFVLQYRDFCLMKWTDSTSKVKDLRKLGESSDNIVKVGDKLEWTSRWGCVMEWVRLY